MSKGGLKDPLDPSRSETYLYRDDGKGTQQTRMAGYIGSLLADEAKAESTTKLDKQYKDIISQVDTTRLYKGCTEPESFEARNRFMDYLDARYRTQGFPSTADASTTNMKTLLGEEGLRLYEAALLEESKSKAYRDAVLVASTKEYPGPKWDKQLMLWIGGPSASGKSFSTDLVVDTVVKNDIGALKGKGEKTWAEELTNTTQPSEEKNYVVSIDGGTERKVSLMRKLVLQIAVKQNYTDIDDLEKHSAVDTKAKSCILKAIIKKENSELSVAIPDTFVAAKFHLSNHKKLMSKCAQRDSCVQIFAKTTCEKGHEQDFRNATRYNGSNRKEFKGDRLDIRLDPLQPTPCESKAPANNHDRGVGGTDIAESDYINETLKVGKEAILMDVFNDQICLKKDPNDKGQYIKCTPDEVKNHQVDLVYSRTLYEESQRSKNSVGGANQSAPFLIYLKRDPTDAKNVVECTPKDLENVNVVKFAFCRDVYMKSKEELQKQPDFEDKIAYLRSFSTPQIVVTTKTQVVEKTKIAGVVVASKSNVAEKVKIYNAKSLSHSSGHGLEKAHSVVFSNMLLFGSNQNAVKPDARPVGSYPNKHLKK